jgi:hypothetical protein
MNSKEAADYLRISPRLLDTLAATRKLVPGRIGRRRIYTKEAIDRFVELLLAQAA